jgi:hypothetical protein
MKGHEMRNILLLTIGFSSIFMGCLDKGVEVGEEPGTKNPGKESNSALSASAQPAEPYYSPYNYSWTTAYQGGTFNLQNDPTEFQAFCNQFGEVVTGFGARVANGNVTGIKLYCTSTQGGNLGSIRQVTSGGTPIEATIVADSGYVAIAVGGVVNNSGFKRAVIKQCRWVPSLGQININDCATRSSDGVLDVETQALAMTHFYGTDQARLAISGIGLSAGYEALKVVKLRVGHLVGYPFTLNNLSGGDLRYEWWAPNWISGVSFRTFGGTGDVDLYTGEGFEPVPGVATCVSNSGTNSEYCSSTIRDVNHHVWLRPYAPYTGVSFRAAYW